MFVWLYILNRLSSQSSDHLQHWQNTCNRIQRPFITRGKHVIVTVKSGIMNYFLNGTWNDCRLFYKRMHLANENVWQTVIFQLTSSASFSYKTRLIINSKTCRHLQYNNEPNRQSMTASKWNRSQIQILIVTPESSWFRLRMQERKGTSILNTRSEYRAALG